MKKPVLISLIIILFVLLPAAAQERVCVAFWNVENLHDTIPSRFYDDGDFTPQGRYRWTTERYGRKLGNLARVIGDLGADVMGLAEVENETVVRDLVLALEDDYNYIHRTSGDLRGMDLALIYKGDKFWPAEVRLLPSAATREFLLVKGDLLGEPVSILLCHLPSKANKKIYREAAMKSLAETADSLISNDPARKLIVMGDFNAEQSEKAFRNAFGRRSEAGFFDRTMLFGAMADTKYGGFGSYAYGNRRMLIDHILVSFGFAHGEGLRLDNGRVFVREYMLVPAGADSPHHSRAGYPLRTVTSGSYTGGFSDHLPVYAVFSR